MGLGRGQREGTEKKREGRHRAGGEDDLREKKQRKR